MKILRGIVLYVLILSLLSTVGCGRTTRIGDVLANPSEVLSIGV